MLRITKIVTVLYIFFFIPALFTFPLIPEDNDGDWGEFEEEPANVTNGTVPKDLYVIKTIVYEVGILTDVGNDSTNSTDVHEEVNLTFYNPERNGTNFILDDIPIPIQTNVSGVSVTGLAPADFGTLEAGESSPKLNGTILPHAVVAVKHNVSTTKAEKGAAILDQLSPLIGQK